MSCSFFSEDSHCGPAPGKEDITIVPVKSCANNIFDHLSALGVSGKTKDGNMQIGILGKRTRQNNARHVNLEMSRSIYFLENHSVPLGAGMRKH